MLWKPIETKSKRDLIQLQRLDSPFKEKRAVKRSQHLTSDDRIEFVMFSGRRSRHVTRSLIFPGIGARPAIKHLYSIPRARKHEGDSVEHLNQNSVLTTWKSASWFFSHSSTNLSVLFLASANLVLSQAWCTRSNWEINLVVVSQKEHVFPTCLSDLFYLYIVLIHRILPCACMLQSGQKTDKTEKWAIAMTLIRKSYVISLSTNLFDTGIFFSRHSILSLLETAGHSDFNRIQQCVNGTRNQR